MGDEEDVDAVDEEAPVGDAAEATEHEVEDSNEDPAPFAEGDHATVMTFDHGGMPRYIVAAWVVFLIGYGVYFYTYGLPDLRAWGAP